MERTEAIKIIKTATVYTPEEMEALETLIPELKESEDERIRKLLIWQVHRNIDDLAQSVYDGIKGHDPDLEESIEDWKKCLAWLEKQKESPKKELGKYSEEEELAYRLNWVMQDYYKAGKDDEEKEHRFKCYKLFWDALEDENFFEQKEQKPAEFSSSNDSSEYDKGYMDGKAFQLKQVEQYSIGKTFMGLIPCWVNAPSTLQPAHKYHGKNVVIMHKNNGGFRCVCIDDNKPVTAHLPEDTLFVEGWRKKPAEWSDEDEKKIVELKNFIAQCNGFNKENRKKAFDMIDALRYQPKQEWSEEDKDMLNSCISSIEEAKENRYAYKETDGDTSYDHEIDWLKSLRPSWKPSEER